MKIAIQGNPTRGKEVIRILESLGGKNSIFLEGDNQYVYYGIYKNEIMVLSNSTKYKRYTLEEFEKEFPFKIGDRVIFPVKIGWASGKVTGLTYVENQLKYEVDSRIGGYRYVEPYKLSLYPMKKERIITLTLDKAKEWYKKGGELKEIALQAFIEQELNPLPRSWEEFCRNNPIQDHEAFINYANGYITMCKECAGSGLGIWTRKPEKDRCKCVSQKSAEAHLAMMQLEQLRNCWWNGWEPEWSNCEKYVIKWDKNDLTVFTARNIHAFLTFPTREMAEEFLKCFKDLIEKAGDLI